ncbi:hypothetical protein V8E54_013064 [Elaphomyces granulatus]
MQSHFFHAAKKHTQNPVVLAFAAMAKSNNLLVTDHIALDRERLGEIVKNARTQFQQLCIDAAGGVQTNPRRGVTPVPRRSATPALPIVGPNASVTAEGEQKKGALQYQNDRKKPNVHAGLHHERTTKEFGPLGHAGSYWRRYASQAQERSVHD